MCFQANVLTKTTCLEKLWHEYIGMDITLYILEVAVVEVPVKPETSWKVQFILLPRLVILSLTNSPLQENSWRVRLKRKTDAVPVVVLVVAMLAISEYVQNTEVEP